MTRPQCHNVKVETIERKAVVGAAIQKNGFIYYTKAETCNPHESSSDDDSFELYIIHNCLVLLWNTSFTFLAEFFSIVFA